MQKLYDVWKMLTKIFDEHLKSLRLFILEIQENIQKIDKLLQLITNIIKIKSSNTHKNECYI